MFNLIDYFIDCYTPLLHYTDFTWSLLPSCSWRMISPWRSSWLSWAPCWSSSPCWGWGWLSGGSAGGSRGGWGTWWSEETAIWRVWNRSTSVNHHWSIDHIDYNYIVHLKSWKSKGLGDLETAGVERGESSLISQYSSLISEREFLHPPISAIAQLYTWSWLFAVRARVLIVVLHSVQCFSKYWDVSEVLLSV